MTTSHPPQQQEQRPLSFGERAVGLNNPSLNPEVEASKREFAACIDRLNELRSAAILISESAHAREVARLASIAITEAQAAQMWAEKAITWGR